MASFAAVYEGYDCCVTWNMGPSFPVIHIRIDDGKFLLSFCPGVFFLWIGISWHVWFLKDY